MAMTSGLFVRQALKCVKEIDFVLLCLKSSLHQFPCCMLFSIDVSIILRISTDFFPGQDMLILLFL